MTIGEVRSKLELNYQKHYENVKSFYYISSEKAIEYIQNQTGCDFDIANQIVHEWMNKSNVEYRNPNENVIKVECPYCHSTKTVKISNISKAGHFALFGIFSLSRNSKQWHCNNCGSDF